MPHTSIRSDNGQAIGLHIYRLACPVIICNLGKSIYHSDILNMMSGNEMQVLTTGCIILLSGLWVESVLIDLVRAFVEWGELGEQFHSSPHSFVIQSSFLKFIPAVKYCEHIRSGEHNSFCLWLTNWSITLVLLYYRISSRTHDNNWTTHVKISGLIKDWRDRPNIVATPTDRPIMLMQ